MNYACQEGDLVELETTVEPTWPKLVEPLERIVDRLQVVWGVVNHLKSVKDSSELRSAIEEIQVIKLKLSSPVITSFHCDRSINLKLDELVTW
jgi:Zn-dependent oligopeptidase